MQTPTIPTIQSLRSKGCKIRVRHIRRTKFRREGIWLANALKPNPAIAEMVEDLSSLFPSDDAYKTWRRGFRSSTTLTDATHWVAVAVMRKGTTDDYMDYRTYVAPVLCGVIEAMAVFLCESENKAMMLELQESLSKARRLKRLPFLKPKATHATKKQKTKDRHSPASGAAPNPGGG